MSGTSPIVRDSRLHSFVAIGNDLNASFLNRGTRCQESLQIVRDSRLHSFVAIGNDVLVSMVERASYGNAGI